MGWQGKKSHHHLITQLVQIFLKTTPPLARPLPSVPSFPPKKITRNHDFFEAPKWPKMVIFGRKMANLGAVRFFYDQNGPKMAENDHVLGPKSPILGCASALRPPPPVRPLAPLSPPCA